MLESFKKPKNLIFSLLVLGFLLRIINFSFPSFTSDEARIAYRAFTIAKEGKDELGRNLPILFNSLTDYQLPVTSYITVLGVFLFGKTDLGVRIPFTLLDLGILYLTFKISQLLTSKKKFSFLSALVLVFSPGLIFLSRIPNDSIVLTFLTTLLFYLLAKGKPNLILITLVIIMSLLVSKFAWFVISPFVIFTLFFYNTDLSKKTKIKISTFCLLVTIPIVLFFLQIPQFIRGLSENNFSIFSEITIQNGINKLRGQGIDSGWPPFLEKIIFNKTHFLIVGLLHWLSNLAPGIYFGQFDKSGVLGFTQMGAFAKILIIPFFLGLVYLIRYGKREEKLILAFFFILTFPAGFSYPSNSPVLIALTLPFAALIIAFGLLNLRKGLVIGIILIMILEIGLNLLYLAPEQKNTYNLRPNWVKKLSLDIYEFSKSKPVIVSDDLVSEDIVPFIEWYNPEAFEANSSNVVYPYKYRESNIKNISKFNTIKIHGSEQTFSSCKSDENKIFLSKRDKNKIEILDFRIARSYKNDLDEEVAFLLEKGFCN